MAEDHDSELHEIDDDSDTDVSEPLSAKDNQKHQLEMRRRLEDRLERRRLRDQLGCEDLWELDY